MDLKKEALYYHSKGRKGKIETGITKECQTQHDITLAYSPGVAEPCKEIAREPQLVYDYTSKGNLVAVVSNGSAVLGLGNIGPLASKPVMEGKAILFKSFADVDCYDIEINAKTVEEMVQCCKMLEPTFGGINLEDIKAPECFEVESRLKEILNIPVFHDDQHGTAIVSAAALLNACELTGRKIENVKCVMNGAGAAALACAQLYTELGLRKENLTLCDSKGVIYKGRERGMNKYKERFARNTELRNISEAIENTDFFCGLSVGNTLTDQMVLKMNENPIIFAMANPDPEMSPLKIRKLRPDAIIATGRSDYENQVNNVLGYPYIFRGALDVLATQINSEMKFAAVKAIAELAKEDVPENVEKSYNSKMSYGKDYLIPKPFDHRLLLRIAPAVAKAAIETGVARKKIDLELYKDQIESRLGVIYSVTRKMKRSIMRLNKTNGKKLRVVLPEGNSCKILKAAEILMQEEICEPILLGDNNTIKNTIQEIGLKTLNNALIINPRTSDKKEKYIKEFYQMRARKGTTELEAYERISRNFHYFGSMMVYSNDADILCSGLLHNYGDVLRPPLQIIGTEKGKVLCGIYMLLWKDKSLFFADTTINFDPNEEQLAQIAIQTHDMASIYLNEEARVAMLSFSNFGSLKHPKSIKIRKAVELVKRQRSDIKIDGEIQADFALSAEQLLATYGFSSLKEDANVLIFPDLTSGNIAYKLLNKLGGATVIGPLLSGMKKPANILARDCGIEEIVNLVTFTVHASQNGKSSFKQRRKYESS